MYCNKQLRLCIAYNYVTGFKKSHLRCTIINIINTNFNNLKSFILGRKTDTACNST